MTLLFAALGGLCIGLGLGAMLAVAARTTEATRPGPARQPGPVVVVVGDNGSPAARPGPVALPMPWATVEEEAPAMRIIGGWPSADERPSARAAGAQQRVGSDTGPARAAGDADILADIRNGVTLRQLRRRHGAGYSRIRRLMDSVKGGEGSDGNDG
jgi:hypothetical protein